MCVVVVVCGKVAGGGIYKRQVVYVCVCNMYKGKGKYKIIIR